ncbi:MAG: LysR family transcriptional regulator, partial [Cyanobacteria bacterium J06626_14]
MPLPNFKLSQLRMLAAVAEHGNFGKAGLSLDVSQSAISHAVASLEEELGVVLIQRGRHGAHLTPIGKEILAHVRQILSLSDTIVQTANVARGLEGGTVQIASFRSFATHVLPPILAQFQEHYPAIHVKIHELSLQKEVEDSIRTGKADIGLLHLPVDETFDSWEFLKDEYKVFAPSHVALSADSLTWSELLQHPIILPPANDSCSQIVREHFEEQHQALNVTYEIKEASTAISMVAQ